MSRSTVFRRFAVFGLFVVALALIAPHAVCAKEKAPQVSEDGLELKKQTKQRLVYVRPGATVAQYHRVAILDCYVEFSKSWLEDYNRDQRDLSRRISDDDLERAKTDLSAQFKKIFSAELAKGGYEVSDTVGPEMLVLRPALVNIQVSAPDLMTPGRSTTDASSAGQMTLYLELVDADTSTILARVMDAKADSESFAQRTTSVDNKAAADEIMRAWAVELRKKLEVAQGKSS